MKSLSLRIMLIVCMFVTSCGHTLVESEYSFDGRTIQRKDWDNVMTELRYYDRDGTEIGTALFHYPGRDGWFLVDNIWDTDKIYLPMKIKHLSPPKIVPKNPFNSSWKPRNSSRKIRLSSCAR